MFQKFAVIAFLLISYFCIPLSAQSDSTGTKTEQGKLYLVLGAGITQGAYAYGWEHSIPAMNFGAEFSTSKTYTNAVQFFAQTWLYDIKKPEYSSLWKEKYIKLSNDIYCHVSLHGMFKYYIGNYKSKFRASLNLGYVFIGTRTSGYGFDYGVGFYYKIQKDTNLELCIRRNTGVFSFNGSTDGPDLLMLNMYYNISR